MSIRAHPPTKKNCIAEDSCVPHLRSARWDRAGTGQHRPWYSTLLMGRSTKIDPGVHGKSPLRTSIRTCRPVHYDVSQNLQASSAAYSFFKHQLVMQTPCAPLKQRCSFYVTHPRLDMMMHRDAFGIPRIFMSLVPYFRNFWLFTDALSTIAFCVDRAVYLSWRGMRVVKAGSEGWTVFHGRRIVFRVSSPDCKPKRTGLVTAGRQGMREMTPGSEGAAGGSSPDCPHRTVLYYNSSGLPCVYNQSVLPEAALRA